MKKKVLTCLVAVSMLGAANIFSGFKFVTPNTDDTKYCGGYDYIEQSETINYASKETTTYSMKGDVPSYCSAFSESSCANVAGTIIIGYYDRFYEELVPNYKTYVQIGSGIIYRISSFETTEVMKKLYTLMGTDVGSAGTTYNGFQSGMSSYVSSCGYSYSINNLGGLDINKYKTEVELGRPVAIFLDYFSMKFAGEDNGTSEVINSDRCNCPHVVVGCGYKIDTYYNSDGQVIATRTYLKVASGLNRFEIGYLCLDGKSKIDIATSVIIQ